MTAANVFLVVGVRPRKGAGPRFVLVDRTEGLLNRRSGHQQRTGATWDGAKTGVDWCRFGVEAGVIFGERTLAITPPPRGDLPSKQTLSAAGVHWFVRTLFMAGIRHDWDEEDYVKSLNDGYEKYRKACYGVCDLPPEQIRETKQAFLSGIHWLATRESYCPDDLEAALRKILGEHNPFIKSS